MTWMVIRCVVCFNQLFVEFVRPVVHSSSRQFVDRTKTIMSVGQTLSCNGGSCPIAAGTWKLEYALQSNIDAAICKILAFWNKKG